MLVVVMGAGCARPAPSAPGGQAASQAPTPAPVPVVCACPESTDPTPLIEAEVARLRTDMADRLEQLVAERVAMEMALIQPVPALPAPRRLPAPRASSGPEEIDTEAEADRTADSAAVWRVALGGHEPSKGPRSAALTFVLWSSVDCALCRRQEGIVEQALNEYGDRARVVWKSHPLPQSEAEELAAQAACAAHRQGRFWEYSQRAATLNGGKRDARMYGKLAQEVGMDGVRFQRDMVSGACREQLNVDRATAARVGIVSVPSLTLNGRKVPGVLPYAGLQEIISEELAKVAALEVGGASRESLYDLLIADGDVQKPLAAETREFSVPGALIGAENPSHVITVFGDYECPYTLALMSTLGSLLDALPEDLAVDYHHFPMAYHQDARRIALAAMEAQAQGQFAKFHSGLLKLPEPLHAKRLERLANRCDMDLERYRAALADGVHEPALEAQMEEARGAGVWATPSIFVDGRQYLSPDRSEAALMEVLVER